MSHAGSSLLALLLINLAAACGPNPAQTGDDVGDDAPPPIDAEPTPVDGPPTTTGVFPEEPIIDPSAPPGAPGMFEPDGPLFGGPCLVEPEPGALFPRNWLRPRFRFVPVGNHNLFEIRLHVAGQPNDLLVYTASTVWTMPADIWQQLNQQLGNQAVEMEVRGGHYNGSGLDAPAVTGSTGSFLIAPVSASGSVVYWTTGAGAGTLKGFDVGDETVQTVLVPSQAGTVCIGCHSSTPDGEFVAFNARNAPTDGRPAYADVRSLDGAATRPAYLTTSAINLLSRPFQHQPVFSGAHWVAGDRIAISAFGQNDPGTLGSQSRLIWTDLEATGEIENTDWGYLARTGDTGFSAAPDFSNDGTTIAYTGAAYISSGMNLDRGGGDIWTVPFNGGAGGAAAKLPGADSTEFSEHYPAFSADDQLVAYTRVPNAGSSYDKRPSEIWVQPYAAGAGGTPVRITANDPPACSGQVSPGLTNSWPKWSPEVIEDSGTRYYWLAFSSRRDPRHIDSSDEEAVDRPRPQLYVTAITVTGNVVTTYPAIYFWNQPELENNHTPAWDNFTIDVE